jgi:hypothetical protein
MWRGLRAVVSPVATPQRYDLPMTQIADLEHRFVINGRGFNVCVRRSPLKDRARKIDVILAALVFLVGESMPIAAIEPSQETRVIAYKVNPSARGKPEGCKIVEVQDMRTDATISFTPSKAFTRAACDHFQDILWKIVRPGDPSSYHVNTGAAIWSSASPDVPTYFPGIPR